MNQLSSYDTCCSHTPESKYNSSSNLADNKSIGNDEKGCQEEKKIQKVKRPMIQLKVPLSKEEEVSRSNGTAGQMQSSNTPSLSQSQSMSQSQSQTSVNGIYNSQQNTYRRNGNTFSDSGSMDDSVEGGFITIDHWTVHATVLPVQLQVLIPRESDWLGRISDSCIEVSLCVLCTCCVLDSI